MNNLHRPQIISPLGLSALSVGRIPKGTIEPGGCDPNHHVAYDYTHTHTRVAYRLQDVAYDHTHARASGSWQHTHTHAHRPLPASAHVGDKVDRITWGRVSTISGSGWSGGFQAMPRKAYHSTNGDFDV